MTGLTRAADTAPPRRPRRLSVTLAATAVLFLLTASQLHAPWADAFVSGAAAVMAMVAILAVELRWTDMVTAAQSRGLVALPARV